ncbi:hypothetical protein [Desulfosudis oleivorans]|uniref:hypothetical protein n=1 Tax=Desulfosudis oleivorans TaxID=181663 RepID=UPI00059CC620|nr:hypothetical protein [Desulfosudis oleivorans]
MDNKNAVEKISENLLTNIGATLLSAFSGNPVASLLPVLTGALASGRHKKRVETAIRKIDAILRAHEAQLKEITDAQYKIINESVLALFQTVEQRKIDYLKNSIERALFLHDVTVLEADALSRVIRDISAAEAKFLLENKDYGSVQIGDFPEESQSDVLFIPKNSPLILIVSGLMSLGLLVPSESVWGAPDRMMFSPICERLVELLY